MKGYIAVCLLGYQNGEIRKYNHKRCCGLWFLIVGIVIIVAALFGGESKINSMGFTVGFVIGFYIALMNKKVVSKLLWGESLKVSKHYGELLHRASISVDVYSGSPIFPNTKWENDWVMCISCGRATFFLFYFVHGISMIGIGFLCSANAMIEMLIPSMPFMAFARIDTMVKIAFGTYLLFSRSRPQTAVNNKSAFIGEMANSAEPVNGYDERYFITAPSLTVPHVFSDEQSRWQSPKMVLPPISIFRKKRPKIQIHIRITSICW